MVHFKEGDDWLVNKDGTKFKLNVYGRLYYFSTVEMKMLMKCMVFMTFKPGIGYLAIVMIFQN